MVTTEDHPSHIKKLSDIREVVDADLGFTTVQNPFLMSAEHRAFLCIISKKVVGCAIAVHIDKAYPVITTPTMEGGEAGSLSRSSSAWCCSGDAVSALVGVSRIWVLSHHRRQGIATRLVDCIRCVVLSIVLNVINH